MTTIEEQLKLINHAKGDNFIFYPPLKRKEILNDIASTVAAMKNCEQAIERYKSGSFMKEAFDSNQNLIAERDRLKEEFTLQTIDLHHHKTLLASCESALSERNSEIDRLKKLNKELLTLLNESTSGIDAKLHPELKVKIEIAMSKS